MSLRVNIVRGNCLTRKGEKKLQEEIKHFSWLRVYSVGLALLLVLYAFIIVHAVYLLKNLKIQRVPKGMS